MIRHWRDIRQSLHRTKGGGQSDLRTDIQVLAAKKQNAVLCKRVIQEPGGRRIERLGKIKVRDHRANRRGQGGNHWRHGTAIRSRTMLKICHSDGVGASGFIDFWQVTMTGEGRTAAG